jgi:histidinol dehydrogenase
VLSRIDLRERVVEPSVLPRAALDVDAALADVAPIVAAVRERGAGAIRELTARFDGVELDDPRVPGGELDDALAGLDPAVRSALAEAADRVRRVCGAQRREPVAVDVVPGGTVTERWVPVRRVGLYVPGGRVAYPSSVVMNVVPAQVAGVEQIAVASPPQPAYGGQPHPAILAACALLGIDEVYAVGGAQAVAMLGLGVAGLCTPVDVVTGPGNVYVAAAKRLLSGRVGVDADAGPTEIAVLADDTATADIVAADLVAQAEHDPLAACLLVTPSARLADEVDRALATRVAATEHRERVEAALSGQSAAVLVRDVEAGIEVVDAWAPEHLEVLTADAGGVADRVRNAGAIFVGPHSPVSLGDYLAGSNHVLPTAGTARFSAGLSVQTFRRRQSVICFDRPALSEAAPHVAALGGAEQLSAHVEAVRTRVDTGAGDSRHRCQGGRAGGAVGGTALEDLPVRDDLRGLSPYGAPQLDVAVRLNTNENPYAPPPALVDDLTRAVLAAATSLNRYPDREATRLRAALADYVGHGVTAKQVWAANGSNEVLQQLLLAFGGPGRTALGFEPSYSMHPLISRATGTRWVAAERRADFAVDPDEAVAAVRECQPDMVFVCTPNNPTGTVTGLDVIEAVVEAAPGIVVVDEAYAEFSAAPSALSLLAGRPRLVVTRTMSKAFAFAGARVGYLAADPAVVDALRLVRLPYHLSALTQAAALAALAHAGETLATVRRVCAERDRMIAGLVDLGLDVAPSQANFVAVGSFADPAATWAALLEEGVLVRDVGLADRLRITAGLPRETDALLTAMRKVGR